MKVSLYKTNKQTKNSCIFQLFLKNEPENANGMGQPARRIFIKMYWKGVNHFRNKQKSFLFLVL